MGYIALTTLSQPIQFAVGSFDLMEEALLKDQLQCIDTHYSNNRRRAIYLGDVYTLRASKCARFKGVMLCEMHHRGCKSQCIINAQNLLTRALFLFCIAHSSRRCIQFTPCTSHFIHFYFDCFVLVSLSLYFIRLFVCTAKPKGLRVELLHRILHSNPQTKCSFAAIFVWLCSFSDIFSCTFSANIDFGWTILALRLWDQHPRMKFGQFIRICRKLKAKSTQSICESFMHCLPNWTGEASEEFHIAI